MEGEGVWGSEWAWAWDKWTYGTVFSLVVAEPEVWGREVGIWSTTAFEGRFSLLLGGFGVTKPDTRSYFYNLLICLVILPLLRQLWGVGSLPDANIGSPDKAQHLRSFLTRTSARGPTAIEVRTLGDKEGSLTRLETYNSTMCSQDLVDQHLRPGALKEL